MKKLKIPFVEKSFRNISLNPRDKFWETAAISQIDNFRDEGSIHKPETLFRVQYSKTGLFLLYSVSDKYVVARHSQTNSNVFEDSCVEFFVKPSNADGYFNFEFNCIGTKLASYIRDSRLNTEGSFNDYQKLIIKDVESISTITTLNEVIEAEIADVVNWKLAAFIPFDIFLNYTGMEKLNYNEPWRCNYYKCADKSSHPHWASWNPISELNFHQPNDFGELIFL